MDFSFIEDPEMRAKAEQEYQESIKAAVEENVAKAVEAEVSGLKAKNEELLTEKKKLMENFKDLDPEKAKEALKFLEENEEARLIQEGKFEEIVEKKTSQIKSDYEARQIELQKQIEDLQGTSTKYKTMFETKVVEDTVRETALKAGVRPEALTDVLMRGNQIFSLGEDGSVEARDMQGNLVKIDDIVMTPDNWVKSLKESAPHYWPPSQSAGASGASGNAGDVMKKLADLAAKGNMVEYRKLRKKMLEKTA
jgi:hypothetical protein